MSSFSITHYDRVTLRPLNELGTLHDPDFTLQVVPGYEADADHGLISEDAPLGRAILNHRRGDILRLQVQGRSLSMRILSVEKLARPPLVMV
ncbi:MAG TPA: GreA/GreB family elongation factor [Prosthecobacter sp.]